VDEAPGAGGGESPERRRLCGSRLYGMRPALPCARRRTRLELFASVESAFDVMALELSAAKEGGCVRRPRPARVFWARARVSEAGVLPAAEREPRFWCSAPPPPSAEIAFRRFAADFSAPVSSGAGCRAGACGRRVDRASKPHEGGEEDVRASAGVPRSYGRRDWGHAPPPPVAAPRPGRPSTASGSSRPSTGFSCLVFDTLRV